MSDSIGFDRATITKEIEALKAKFKDRAAHLNTNEKKALNDCALKVERYVKESMTNTQTDLGVSYQRGSNSHHPSVPGNPPAVDTGRLRASITHRIVDESPAAAYVGTNLDYAYDLEFGTSKMAPRPFLQPAIDANEVWIRNKLSQFAQGKSGDSP